MTMNDKCPICGDDGPDHRTLFLSYLYDLSEISPKLASVSIDVRPPFYRVKTCKRCRADFLGMLRRWLDGELRVPDEPGANIPVRVDGATKMMTLDQFNEFRRANDLPEFANVDVTTRRKDS